jgi:dTDP-4-dehydrorhamnose 3,5-epimerase
MPVLWFGKNMDIQQCDLSGVLLITFKVFGDERGYFMETFRKNRLEEFGVKHDFVQDNQSKSGRNVLRGLHYQLRHPQAKLVRVLEGTLLDAVVDIRRDSPTFGRSRVFQLSGEKPQSLYIPAGFAHGLYVTSSTAVLSYKCSDYYHPDDECGIAWNDPDLGIRWPIPGGAAPIMSEKDRRYPNLKDVPEAELPVYPRQ